MYDGLKHDGIWFGEYEGIGDESIKRLIKSGVIVMDVSSELPSEVPFPQQRETQDNEDK